MLVNAEARVVEPAAAEPPADDHRWRTAVESMAGAIARGEDPADFADTLDRILNEQEIGMLRLSTTEQVMEQLVEGAVGRFPVLAQDGARSYVEAVLSELRNPSEEAVEP